MGASIWQLLIILAIVLVLFGAKRLRSLGTDLGASIKGFREAMKDDVAADRTQPSTSTTARLLKPIDDGDPDNRGRF